MNHPEIMLKSLSFDANQLGGQKVQGKDQKETVRRLKKDS